MALSARVPDLAALEVLLSVARTGSLGRAAQEAGVSQQAVSARIRAMEAQTGVTLVQRTARGSSLTADGAVHVEDVAERALRVQMGGEDALVAAAARAGAQEHRPGAIAEQHACAAVLPVQDTRVDLATDDQRAA